MKKDMTKKGFLVISIMMLCSLMHLYGSGNQAQSSGGQPITVNYPAKPITLIVGNAPGGGNDLTARAVARFSQKYLGVEMVVENRVGGNMVVANTYFNTVPLDGYTILTMGTDATTIIPLIQKVEYDPMKDQDPIGGISNNRNILCVKSDSRIRSFDEFIKYCQDNPGQKIATSGAIGVLPLTVQMLNMNYHTGLVPVPYDSTGLAVLAVVSGETLGSVGSMGGAKVQLNAGTVKGLVLFGHEPDPDSPEYKTAKQLGYDIALNNYVGFAVRTGTDPVIRKKLEDFLLKLPNDPEFVELMKNLGFPIDPLDGEGFRQYLISEINTVKKILASTD
jgi:tripartite-type tricarboxylate transporter receptor subunit TctC